MAQKMATVNDYHWKTWYLQQMRSRRKSRVPVEPVFTPLSLFLKGEQGAWYDPSDLSTLFQDSAGTVPVVASGDPAGLMLDKSGNGNHASQSISGYRHTYFNDVNPRIYADGIDDFLQSVYSGAVSTPAVLSVAIDRKEQSGGKVIVTGLDADTRHQISVAGIDYSASRLGAYSNGTGLDSTPSPFMTGIYVITFVLNGASSELRLNGVVIDSGTVPDVASLGITISAARSGTNPHEQDVFGIVHCEGNIDKVPEIEQYLAQKAGVTL